MSDFYDSNEKHTNGRGWAMNRILERLPVHPSGATVVYLAGEGRDRDLFLKRGFRNENIIAVDTDRRCVDAVRSVGGLAVRGEIAQVLAAWPAEWPIHVVMADYNCGLDAHVLQFIAVLRSPCLHPRSAVYVNLMRGRDDLGKSPQWNTILASNGGVKSRANQFLIMSLAVLAVMAGLDTTRPGVRYALVKHDVPQMKPVFAVPYRQRAGGVVMDGVVFTRPPGTYVLHALADEEWWPAMRRKLAALRAVRTRMAA